MNVNAWWIPEGQLTEDEFLERLKWLRRSHERELELLAICREQMAGATEPAAGPAR